MLLFAILRHGSKSKNRNELSGINSDKVEF